MRFLFIDNFRGFCNASIPLFDVNFLVGQNSTGKTSLLTMLRMFSNPSLFMGPQLGGDDVQFGHFNEMVSAHSQDRTYFRLGVVEERTKKHGSASVTGMLFTYREDQGLPQISRLTCALEGRELNLRFEGGKVFYKSKSLPDATSAEKMNSLIPQWVISHRDTGVDWIELDLPDGFKRDQVPLFMVLSWAAQRLNTSEAREFTFFAPTIGPPLIWIAPIRTAPRRTYDEPHTVFSSEGSHTPYVIRRMLSSQTEAKKFQEFMARVGEASGLFQRIDIKYFGSADDPTSPFEVDAFVDDKALSLGWLGYGVSQSLPIFVELLDRPKGHWFAIQQPEVHLHPRAQASLGDVFFEMAVRDNKRFVIETHSDFTIDRFRMNYRGRKSKKEKANLPTSQILFFERKDACNTVTSLPIGADGELPKVQPSSYRRFFVKEEMRLLGL
jgi:hypothetical protein